jgi:hypothetical protein
MQIESDERAINYRAEAQRAQRNAKTFNTEITESTEKTDYTTMEFNGFEYVVLCVLRGLCVIFFCSSLRSPRLCARGCLLLFSNEFCGSAREEVCFCLAMNSAG